MAWTKRVGERLKAFTHSMFTREQPVSNTDEREIYGIETASIKQSVIFQLACMKAENRPHELLSRGFLKSKEEFMVCRPFWYEYLGLKDLSFDEIKECTEKTALFRPFDFQDMCDFLLLSRAYIKGMSTDSIEEYLLYTRYIGGRIQQGLAFALVNQFFTMTNQEMCGERVQQLYKEFQAIVAEKSPPNQIISLVNTLQGIRYNKAEHNDNGFFRDRDWQEIMRSFNRLSEALDAGGPDHRCYLGILKEIDTIFHQTHNGNGALGEACNELKRVGVYANLHIAHIDHIDPTPYFYKNASSYARELYRDSHFGEIPREKISIEDPEFCQGFSRAVLEFLQRNEVSAWGLVQRGFLDSLFSWAYEELGPEKGRLFNTELVKNLSQLLDPQLARKLLESVELLYYRYKDFEISREFTSISTHPSDRLDLAEVEFGQIEVLIEHKIHLMVAELRRVGLAKGVEIVSSVHDGGTINVVVEHNATDRPDIPLAESLLSLSANARHFIRGLSYPKCRERVFHLDNEQIKTVKVTFIERVS